MVVDPPRSETEINKIHDSGSKNPATLCLCIGAGAYGDWRLSRAKWTNDPVTQYRKRNCCCSGQNSTPMIELGEVESFVLHKLN